MLVLKYWIIFYFIISIRTVYSITGKKLNEQKSMTTFLANAINSTGGDVTVEKRMPKFRFL